MSVAANPTPAPLHAFIEKDKTKKFKDRNSLDMREAYSWNRDQIIKWLFLVAKDPVVWGQPDPNVKPRLEELAEWIKDLSLPAGKEFKAGTDWSRQPSQHISRSYVADWYGKDLNKPKFSVRGFVSGGIHLFNHYDMLGLFLGLLGPANPGQVNKYNFYLPLAAMYAQWCSELGTVAWPGDILALPTMFQCTWDVKSGWYRLGASLGGHFADRGGDNATGTWLEVIRDARHAVLTQHRNNRIHFNVERGTELLEEGKKEGEETPWGNCAETYPFIDTFWGDQHYNQSYIRGVALKYAVLFDQDAARMAREAGTRKFYDDARYGYVYKHQEGPCINCRELINLAIGPHKNFYHYGMTYGEDQFPDRRAEREIERKERAATAADKAEAAKMRKDLQDKQDAKDKADGWTKV
ncbi:hypothetical protein RB595_002094 [Gaeumannomyces hyphopodioides]